MQNGWERIGEHRFLAGKLSGSITPSPQGFHELSRGFIPGEAGRVWISAGREIEERGRLPELPHPFLSALYPLTAIR